MLVGAVVAARVEVFGAVGEVVACGPGKLVKQVMMINPAYVTAPYEDVIYGHAAVLAKLQPEGVEGMGAVFRYGREPGECPKNFEMEGAVLDPFPARWEFDQGKFRQVMPYHLVDVEDNI